MKRTIQSCMIIALMFLFSCGNSNKPEQDNSKSSDSTPAATDMGQAGVKDDVSQKDVVKIAVGSPDHTTLVAALKQAEYVKELSNAGPFTVFAPTNAAFAKLPPGTVEGLMKADQKSALQNILEYHVAVGVYKEDYLQDGQSIEMVNSKNITIQMKDGKILVNGTANVVAAIPASNGLIYVIDAVLLPPSK